MMGCRVKPGNNEEKTVKRKRHWQRRRTDMLLLGMDTRRLDRIKLAPFLISE
jgi:hypothetical protein